MFVKVTNGQLDQYPYTVGELRRDNPNTSFPKRLSEDLLKEWGAYPVKYKPQPDHDKRTQRPEQDTQPHQENGEWFIGWSVVDKTADEIQIYDDKAAASVRSNRDILLTITDWVVIKAQETGNSIPADWATYRQALRDITSHANFPHLQEADWPVKPE